MSETIWVQQLGSYPELINEPPLVEVPSYPLPTTAFRQGSDYPYLANEPPLVEVPSYPLPNGCFVQDGVTNDGYPYLYDAATKGPGAFCYAEKLIKVSIPESVKKIGKEAFRHTALRKVRIAADCEYSDTSFPENCEITFYSSIGSSDISGEK